MEPLPKKRTGIEFIVVVTNRYSNLLRAILTKTATASETVYISVDKWVAAYGYLDWLLADSVTLCSGKRFNIVCVELRTELVTTSDYRLQ